MPDGDVPLRSGRCRAEIPHLVGLVANLIPDGSGRRAPQNPAQIGCQGGNHKAGVRELHQRKLLGANQGHHVGHVGFYHERPRRQGRDRNAVVGQLASIRNNRIAGVADNTKIAHTDLTAQSDIAKYRHGAGACRPAQRRLKRRVTAHQQTGCTGDLPIQGQRTVADCGAASIDISAVQGQRGVALLDQIDAGIARRADGSIERRVRGVADRQRGDVATAVDHCIAAPIRRHAGHRLAETRQVKIDRTRTADAVQIQRGCHRQSVAHPQFQGRRQLRRAHLHRRAAGVIIRGVGQRKSRPMRSGAATFRADGKISAARQLARQNDIVSHAVTANCSVERV